MFDCKHYYRLQFVIFTHLVVNSITDYQLVFTRLIVNSITDYHLVFTCLIVLFDRTLCFTSLIYLTEIEYMYRLYVCILLFFAYIEKSLQ